MSNATYHIRTRIASDRLEDMLQAALDEARKPLAKRYNAPNKPLLPTLAEYKPFTTAKFGMKPKPATIQ